MMKYRTQFVTCVIIVALSIITVSRALAEETPVVQTSFFSEEVKTSADGEILSRVEHELQALLNNSEGSGNSPLKIVKGKVKDIERLNPSVPCGIEVVDGRYISVVWTLEDDEFGVEMPISYQSVKGGERGEIENRLIEAIKRGDAKQRPVLGYSADNLVPYGEEGYVIPGESYLKKDVITRNVYLASDEGKPIWSKERPGESVANLFIYPSKIYGEKKVAVTISKHEYGEKESFTVALNDLLDAMVADCCIPYWGVEKIENGVLKGTVFFLNKSQGYDHVMRVKCDLDELFSGDSGITATLSLYIPGNNVRNLFAPYVKKTENEKIKYDK